MANRWMRQAEQRVSNVPQDPVSNQIARSLKDERNLLALDVIRKNSGSAGLDAILLPIVQTVAEKVKEQLDQGGTPKQEDTTQLLNGYLKQKVTMLQIDDLERKNGGNGAAPDVMAFAKGAVDIQQGAAQTAIRMAEIERQRRMEAEEEVSAAAAYARQEEQQKAQQTIEIIKEMNAMNQTMLQQLHTKEMEFKDYQMKTTVESIQKAAEDAIARISASSQEALALKDQLTQHQIEALKKDYEIEKLKTQSALPLNQNPEYIHQLNWVNFNALQQQQALQHEQEKHESVLATHAMIREQLPNVIQTVREFAGGRISVDNPLASEGAPPPPTGPGLGGIA